MQAATHTNDSVVRNWRIRFILASAFWFSVLAPAVLFSLNARAEDPPSNLMRLIAARETETAEAQSH